MNLDKLMGLSGIELEIGLKTVELSDLKAAIAAAELEIHELEATVSGLKAKQEKLKTDPFGGYFEEQNLTKLQLLGKLRKLKAKKEGLLKEKASLGLNISKFKVKSSKTIDNKVVRSRNRDAIIELMEQATDQEKFRALESDTLLEVAILAQEGFDPDQAYDIVLNRNAAELSFEDDEEGELF